MLASFSTYLLFSSRIPLEKGSPFVSAKVTPGVITGGYCLYHKCEHGGTCVEQPHGYDCICTPQYTGPHCGGSFLTSSSVYNSCLGGVRAVCENQETWLNHIPLYTVDKCANCHINAECIYGRCRCMKGYIGTGYVCEKGRWKFCIVVFLVVLISNRIRCRVTQRAELSEFVLDLEITRQKPVLFSSCRQRYHP